MDKKIKSVLWLVGGSGKLGQAIAESLQDKYSIVNMSRKKCGFEAAHYSVDLADLPAVDELLATLKEVPRAIVFCQRYRPIADFVSAEAFNTEIFSTQKIIENLMTKGEPLSIVVVSSVNGLLINTKLPFWYHLLKTSQIQLVKYYSLFPININCIAAGTFLKDDVKNYPIPHQEFFNALQETNPSRKICTVQDIAQIIEFLISERAQCINGQTITPDGGLINKLQEELVQSHVLQKR